MLRQKFSTRLALPVLLTAPAFGQLFEFHYLYRGQYPDEQTSTPWSDGAEGVAHDDDHWFVTHGLPNALWKIPVGFDLRTFNAASPSVIRFSFAAGHELWNHGYRFFGDPDVHRFDGVDYLVVPVTGIIVDPDDCIPAGGVAFFRCSDLSYIDFAELPGQCGDAAWVAVSDSGEIYSSRTHIGLSDPSQRGVRVYTVDWNALANTGEAIINFSRDLPLLDESGAPLELVTVQGGDLTTGDGLLYLSSGNNDDDIPTADREGIHVIETATFQRIRHSSRGEEDTLDLFDFYYNPNEVTDPGPRGLTLWDLDDGRAPGIAGQLHVLIRQNWWTPDRVQFKHYTRAMTVDRNWSGCQTGTPTCPFQSIPAAMSRIWDGGGIRIRAGTYPNPITISRRLRLSSENGAARIGG